MRGRLLVLGSVLALLASACGGDDGGAVDTAGTESAQTDESGSDDGSGATDSTVGGSDSGAGDPSPGGTGSFTVNGESVNVTGLFRCEPYADPGSEADPRDLAIVIFGDTAGANIDVTYHEGTGPEFESFEQVILDVLLSVDGVSEQFDGLAASNINGDWFLGFQAALADQEGDTPLDGPPYTINGNNISGSLSAMEQSWPQDVNGTAEMTFDVPIPDETVDC